MSHPRGPEFLISAVAADSAASGHSLRRPAGADVGSGAALVWGHISHPSRSDHIVARRVKPCEKPPF
jgi:hypothetical protein